MKINFELIHNFHISKTDNFLSHFASRKKFTFLEMFKIFEITA